MTLPPTFHTTIANGVRALLTEENRLRKLSCNGDPRVLLTLRDVAGLRERLEGTTREKWEAGDVVSSFALQDIGVVEELASRYATSPDRDEEALGQLREALLWYLDNGTRH